MAKLKSSEEIRMMLKQHNFSVSDLCKKFNIHKSTMHRYMTGESTMSATFLYDLAKFTNIDIYAFFEGESNLKIKKFRGEKNLS